jgi:hypothetical protein
MAAPARPRGPQCDPRSRPVAAHVGHWPWLPPDHQQRLGGLGFVDRLLLALRLDLGVQQASLSAIEGNPLLWTLVAQLLIVRISDALTISTALMVVFFIACHGLA